MTYKMTHGQRLALGVVVLLMLDIVWVLSSQFTQYISHKKYDKPFFATYFRTVMFSLYLFGFIVWRPWRQQCCQRKDKMVVEDMWSGSATEDGESEIHLGDPIFVPLKYDQVPVSGNSTEDEEDGENGKSVRFSDLSEVRQLSEEYAEDAMLSRLSYQAFKRAQEDKQRLVSKLSVKQVFKLAVCFCVLWFFAVYMYLEALRQTKTGIVHVLGSTSSLFTLICAATYPTSQGDKFTLSKLVTVLVSFGGVIIVYLPDLAMEDSIPDGALWAVVSAVLYTCYLVLVRYRVQSESRMDIPMFLGFVGLVCAMLMWPGFFVLHYSQHEVFEWPEWHQWLVLVTEGLVCTVFSTTFWLWACFLTSALVATLAFTLIHPLTIMLEMVIKQVDCTPLFYLGCTPIFASFVVIVYLTYWDTWDPLLLSLNRVIHSLCRPAVIQRLQELDKEQTASLISEETS